MLAGCLAPQSLTCEAEYGFQSQRHLDTRKWMLMWQMRHKRLDLDQYMLTTRCRLKLLLNFPVIACEVR